METAKPKPKNGRPSKMVPEAAAVVVEYVRKGCPRQFAASAAGIGRSTLMRWMARGKAERRGKFRDFWDAIKKAEAEAVFDRVQCIKAASDKGTWQAAAWWLERLYPEEFGTQRREIKELTALIREAEKMQREQLQRMNAETAPSRQI
jgi:transposase